MTFARVALFPGGTEDQHKVIVEGLGDGYENAPGRLLFAAGATPEGWQIIQIWESRDDMDRWVDDHLGKAFAHAGPRGYPSPPQIIDFEIADLLLQPAL